MWRILNNSLATNVSLFRRRRAKSRPCQICEEADESLEHLFFHCPWTRCVWFGSLLNAKFDANGVHNFNAWWLLVTGSKRNEMAVHWFPPDADFLKVSCDGAFSAVLDTASIGVVCRNCWGHFQWGFIDKIKSISALMIKALALKKALMLTMDLGHDKVLFESDCLLLHSCISAKSPDLCEWKSRSIVHDIIYFLNSKVGFSVSFTPRRGNRVADFLVTTAYKDMYPIGWVSQPSPVLLLLLTSDIKEAHISFLVMIPCCLVM